MAFVGSFFAAAGRLSVRFRWAVVLAWVAGAAAAMALLPSLSSVTQSDTTSFLPPSAPSEQAARLASPLQGATLTAVTVVAARTGGPLTGACPPEAEPLSPRRWGGSWAVSDGSVASDKPSDGIPIGWDN
jgi:hypothetical protein